jgi:chromosome segregation ATPase
VDRQTTPPTNSQAPYGSPRAKWINELEERLLISLRCLKEENHELRAEVRRLQDSLGEAHGVKEVLSSKSRELESQLQRTQLKNRETAQEVQWLLKHSQEVLEMRQQELQRLRSELEAANTRLQQCEGMFARGGNFPRKKVLLPRNRTSVTNTSARNG